MSCENKKRFYLVYMYIIYVYHPYKTVRLSAEMSHLNLSLFYLLIGMLINIVFSVSMAVLCSKTYLNVIFFNNFVQQLCYFCIINLFKLTYDWLMNDM